MGLNEIFFCCINIIPSLSLQQETSMSVTFVVTSQQRNRFLQRPVGVFGGDPSQSDPLTVDDHYRLGPSYADTVTDGAPPTMRRFHAAWYALTTLKRSASAFAWHWTLPKEALQYLMGSPKGYGILTIIDPLSWRVIADLPIVRAETTTQLVTVTESLILNHSHGEANTLQGVLRSQAPYRYTDPFIIKGDQLFLEMHPDDINIVREGALVHVATAGAVTSPTQVVATHTIKIHDPRDINAIFPFSIFADESTPDPYPANTPQGVDTVHWDHVATFNLLPGAVIRGYAGLEGVLNVCLIFQEPVPNDTDPRVLANVSILSEAPHNGRRVTYPTVFLIWPQDGAVAPSLWVFWSDGHRVDVTNQLVDIVNHTNVLLFSSQDVGLTRSAVCWPRGDFSNPIAGRVVVASSRQRGLLGIDSGNDPFSLVILSGPTDEDTSFLATATGMNYHGVAEDPDPDPPQPDQLQRPFTDKTTNPASSARTSPGSGVTIDWVVPSTVVVQRMHWCLEVDHGLLLTMSLYGVISGQTTLIWRMDGYGPPSDSGVLVDAVDFGAPGLLASYNGGQREPRAGATTTFASPDYTTYSEYRIAIQLSDPESASGKLTVRRWHLHVAPTRPTDPLNRPAVGPQGTRGHRHSPIVQVELSRSIRGFVGSYLEIWGGDSDRERHRRLVWSIHQGNRIWTKDLGGSSYARNDQRTCEVTLSRLTLPLVNIRGRGVAVTYFPFVSVFVRHPSIQALGTSFGTGAAEVTVALSTGPPADPTWLSGRNTLRFVVDVAGGTVVQNQFGCPGAFLHCQSSRKEVVRCIDDPVHALPELCVVTPDGDVLDYPSYGDDSGLVLPQEVPDDPSTAIHATFSFNKL